MPTGDERTLQQRTKLVVVNDVNYTWHNERGAMKKVPL